VLSPDSTAVFRPLDAGGVILNVENGDYFRVNQTGRHIWEMIETGTDRESLTSDLVERYGLAPEEAGADVDEFLAELRKRSLLAPD
jgi:hypothetical protein